MHGIEAHFVMQFSSCNSLDAEVKGVFLRRTQSNNFMGEAKKNNKLL